MTFLPSLMTGLVLFLPDMSEKNVEVLKWASDCCLMLNGHFLSYIMARISCIQWNDVGFVLDHHTYLGFLNC